MLVGRDDVVGSPGGSPRSGRGRYHAATADAPVPPEQTRALGVTTTHLGYTYLAPYGAFLTYDR